MSELTIPERIWLQIEVEDYWYNGTEGDAPDEALIDDISDATWHFERIHDSDIEYVRRDVADRLRTALQHIHDLPLPERERFMVRGWTHILEETKWLEENDEAPDTIGDTASAD